jgi:hypothetical protein
MNIFLLPKCLCADINSQMRKFWCGSQEKENRVNWLCWDKMGMAKVARGMGFRDFTHFNKALLAKQGWRLWRYPDSLVVKIMKAKYYPDGLILVAKMGGKPSFVGRSIHSSCGLPNEGLFWCIRN